MSDGIVRARLAELGLTLHGPHLPHDPLDAVVVWDGVARTSGQLPRIDGRLTCVGRLGDTVSVEQGREAPGVSALNALYRLEPALHEVDFEAAGFEWIDARDAEASVIAFLRRARSGPPVLVVCNFTPVPRMNYVLGVPQGGRWRELLNGDAAATGDALSQARGALRPWRRRLPASASPRRHPRAGCVQ